ncbi:hypothetical protein BZJ17_07180 [Salinivibrio sp. IB574]|uniref:hypothetical protein n=1 Tax=Salinivibrio sp. IB574 TaxID=1909444 RepID=UPI000988AE25|nr:hypothetical protein [Salinivibrio sp. IB574]OOF22304.1 hypothetical protein BZJ17_07180 [Salinivibrio sp. IB574]
MNKVMLALITSLLCVSGTAIAANYETYCKGNNENSQVCKAYLAGVEDGKAAASADAEPARDADSSSFSERALEHRAGERVRKPLDKDDMKN